MNVYTVPNGEKKNILFLFVCLFIPANFAKRLDLFWRGFHKLTLHKLPLLIQKNN